MSVRRRAWTDPVAGKTVDAWFVDVKFRSLDGHAQTDPEVLAGADEARS